MEETITFHINKLDKEKFKRYAREDGLKMSSFARFLAKKEIKKREEQEL